jgi:hypothetical protein
MRRPRIRADGWRSLLRGGDLESHWSVTQFCLTMRRTRRSSSLLRMLGLLRSGRSRAPMHERAARRSMTGVAAATTAEACGEMRHVMVGFRWTDQCARGALMPFAVGTHVAYNVLRFPTAREPTVRAAEACPPPFMEITYLARGGQQPAGLRRGKRLLSAVQCVPGFAIHLFLGESIDSHGLHIELIAPDTINEFVACRAYAERPRNPEPSR